MDKTVDDFLCRMDAAAAQFTGAIAGLRQYLGGGGKKPLHEMDEVEFSSYKDSLKSKK